MIFHHLFPFSSLSHLHLLPVSTHLLTSLLFSPLLPYLSLSLLSSFSLSCVVVVFSVLCCRRFLCLVLSSFSVVVVGARVAAVAAGDEGRKPREMRAMRPDWSLESIKTKLKHLRRGAPDECRPLKRRRTTEVLAEIETAVTETPRQTLSVLRRRSSLDMSRSTLWRALQEDLQARCFKPVRATSTASETQEPWWAPPW